MPVARRARREALGGPSLGVKEERASIEGCGVDRERAREVDRAGRVAADRERRAFREGHGEPAGEGAVLADGQGQRGRGVPSRSGSEEVDERNAHRLLSVEGHREDGAA